jgi:hypothetical protein
MSGKNILGGWWVTPTTGKFDFLPLAMRYWNFFLDEKVSKKSRKNEASTPEGKTPGPPFFHPYARVL